MPKPLTSSAAWCLALVLGLLPGHQLRAQAQPGTAWVSFEDPKTKLIGYRDAEGRVQIAPRLRWAPPVLEHIASVVEKESGPDKEDYSFKSYYLLRDGRRIGGDSVFSEDNTPGCESEGLIRFRDRKTDRVGFFDGQGRVAIPAAYNYAGSFHNGVALALRGARKMCWEGGTYDPRHPCEHPRWEGGQSVLINQQNQVLVENLDEHKVRSLNWYTLRVDAAAPDTALYAVFAGTDGRQYSFLDSEKEFRQWFYTRFLPECSPATLDRFCFEGIAFWGRNGWKYEPRPRFLASKARLITQKMAEIKAGQYPVQLFDDDLNQFLFTGRKFDKYVSTCGRHKSAQYPVFSVVVTHPAGPRDDYQEHFEFLRTDEGYRLISVSLRVGKPR